MLILLLLLQDPSAFAGGDDSAREALLKQGAYSIRPLLAVRSKSPDRVDALLYDIKKPAASEAALAAMTAKITVEFDSTWDDAAAGLRTSFSMPILVDPKLPEDTRATAVKFKVVDRPGREALDALCRAAELDYAFLYGRIVISTPDRLWPDKAPAKVVELAGDALAAAKADVEKLDSENVEERGTAESRLRALGPSAIPLLEEGSKRKEREIANQCAALLTKARRPPPMAVFRAAGYERQKLGEDQAAVIEKLKKNVVSIRVRNLAVVGVLKLTLQPQQVDHEIGAALRRTGTAVSIDYQSEPLLPMLAVTCHACGYDFILREGKLYFDTVEEIEKILAGGK